MNASASLSIDAQCHEWAERGMSAAVAVHRWDWRHARHAEGDVPAILADRIIAARTAQAQQAQGGAL